MSRLGKVRPAVWGVLYLVAIPTFALVFWLLPGRPFYHSTIQYEATLNEDAGPLLAALRAAIVANFRACNRGDIVEVNGWRLDIKDLDIYGLRPTAEAIELRAFLQLTRLSQDGQLAGYTRMPFSLSYSASERNYYLSGVGPNAVATFTKTLSFQPEHLDLLRPEAAQRFEPLSYSVLFPRCSIPFYAAPVLTLPAELNERLQGFWRATRGLPTSVSGGFWRMLYLSSMTITTVGYGDITPITTPARLLVSAEAILGIVLIGLFLNSLASRWN